MFKIILVALLMMSSLAHAESEKTKIKEIKSWVQSVPLNSTCADEYLKNRRHLGIKIGLTPVIITGAAAVGLFSGAFIGFKVFLLVSGTSASAAPVPMGPLILGEFIGVLTGLGISGTTSISNVVNFFRNQNLLRLIYESRNQGGIAVEKFFDAFIENYPRSSMNKDQFMSRIEELDLTGALCDGSLVDHDRYKHGKKLRQRLANGDEIFKKLAQ
jgi:hypothetical protein